MRFFKFTTAVWVFLIFAIDCMESAKILAVFPFTGPSQYLCVQPYLKTLAARGHEVTSISTFPQKTPIKNLRDIVLNGAHDKHDELVIELVEEMADGKLKELHEVWEYTMMASLLVLKNEEFQQLLHSNEHFDLIIIEAFLQESLYALRHHFNAPLVGVCTYGTDVSIDQLVDNISPFAYVPAPTGKNLDRMNFWQRLDNLYTNTMELAYTHLKIIPDQQRVYEKYFPNATADLSEIRRDFSLLLLNQHYSFNYPRPLVPNAIEVAGMHIDHKPKKLPADMEAFINASPNGAIYFSLGANVKSAFLPNQKLTAIMDAFAKLPVNVLWKFEKDDLPGKPKNVYISKWFPQPDILAHPNLKLFITHGGMHSLLEAVHHGKPIVGMPVFADQHLNVARAEAKGFGVSLNFKHFTGDELRNAILEVLKNPKYADTAKEISAIFHDRPMKPLDTAIYWTEYVLRHKGAPQMRVAARYLNFWQRHSVDTIAVLFGIPLLIVNFIFYGVFKLFKVMAGGKIGLQGGKRKKD